MTGWDVLRIGCGLYFIPHAIAKTLSHGPHKAEIVGFFTKAGLRPASVMIPVAATVELVCMLGLVTGFHGRWAAWLAAAYLALAAAALVKVGGPKWLWVHRGCEYPLFWAFVCTMVALNA